MDKAIVRTILVDTSGIQKVCAEMVPRLLTEEQKAQRLNACSDILQQMKNSRKTSSQEMSHGSFNMIRKTKQQSRQWKSLSSPKPKKVRLLRSQVKVMLITFFDHQGMMHHEFVPPGKKIKPTLLQGSSDLSCQQNSSKTKRFMGRKNLDLASQQCSCPHSPQHGTVLGFERNHHIASSTLFAGQSPL